MKAKVGMTKVVVQAEEVEFGDSVKGHCCELGVEERLTEVDVRVLDGMVVGLWQRFFEGLLYQRFLGGHT